MGKPNAHDIDDDDDNVDVSNLDDDTVDLDPDAEGGDDDDRGDNLDSDAETDEDDGEDEGEEAPAGQVNTDDIPAELLEEIIGKGGKVPAMVPYARLAEVVSQNKQLVNALLERGHSVPGQAAPKEDAPPPFDMKGAMREKNKAIMEGDEDAALEWEEKIEAERQRVADERALQVLNTQRAYESATEAANRVVAAYPQLQDDSDQYDQEVLEDIIALRDTYIARGTSSAEAIEKAARRLLGDPPSAADDAGDPGDPEAKRKKLAKEKVLRNAQASKRQPPPIGKRGDASPKHGAEADMDPSEPSEEEWDALPEKEKARLRGDYVD